LGLTISGSASKYHRSNQLSLSGPQCTNNNIGRSLFCNRPNPCWRLHDHLKLWSCWL